MTATWITRVSVFAAAVFLIMWTTLAAGCSPKEQEEAVDEYPVVHEFETAGDASGAAGFEVREPEYTAGGELEGVIVVEVSPERNYVDLVYSNNLELSESPRSENAGYDQAIAQHEQCLQATPENLRTYEEPIEVDIGGNKGILWMHRGSVVLQEREETGIPSFHVPYIVWWDSELEYRLWIDDPRLFEDDPAEGVEVLRKVADSVYR